MKFDVNRNVNSQALHVVPHDQEIQYNVALALQQQCVEVLRDPAGCSGDALLYFSLLYVSQHKYLVHFLN